MKKPTKKQSIRTSILNVRKRKAGQRLANNVGVTETSGAKAIFLMKKPKRKIIVSPVILDFERNYTETIGFLEDIRRFTLRVKIDIFIDMSRCYHISPDAAMVLLAEIQRSNAIRPKSINGCDPKECRPRKLLMDVGFHKLLKFNEVKEEIEAIDAREYAHITCGGVGITEGFVPTIDLVFGDFARLSGVPARNQLTLGFNEAMANVMQHAYEMPHLLQYEVAPDLKWWMGGYRDPQEKEAMFMFYDQGGTIPAHLKKKFSEYVRQLYLTITSRKAKNDGLLIQAATKIGRTGTSKEGRGWGLYDMRQFVGGPERECDFPDAEGGGNIVRSADVASGASNGSSLRILSRRGSYVYTPARGDDPQPLPQPFWGTLIVWRLVGSDKIVWTNGTDEADQCG